MSGQLHSIAFRKGFNCSGGMPDDFDTSKHRLQPVRLKNFHGRIFGTFDWEIDPSRAISAARWKLIKRNFGAHKAWNAQSDYP